MVCPFLLISEFRCKVQTLAGNVYEDNSNMENCECGVDETKNEGLDALVPEGRATFAVWARFLCKKSDKWRINTMPFK